MGKKACKTKLDASQEPQEGVVTVAGICGLRGMMMKGGVLTVVGLRTLWLFLSLSSKG